jgi:hypothetical protein
MIYEIIDEVEGTEQTLSDNYIETQRAVREMSLVSDESIKLKTPTFLSEHVSMSAQDVEQSEKIDIKFSRSSHGEQVVVIEQSAKGSWFLFTSEESALSDTLKDYIREDVISIDDNSDTVQTRYLLQ